MITERDVEHQNSTKQDTVVETQKNSMQSITKDMICKKFNGKDINVEVRLRSFNMECERSTIPQDLCVAALCLILEGTPEEWFQSNWTLIGVTFLESLVDDVSGIIWRKQLVRCLVYDTVQMNEK